VVDAGLTTTLAIALAVGISEDEAQRVLSGEIEPNDEHCEKLEHLQKDYARAVRRMSAEAMKKRLSEG
jgi:hypothetical protein